MVGLVALVAALLASPSTSADAATANRAPDFRWVLEVEGIGTSAFREVTGLGSENEVVEHRVVDELGREITRKLPGPLQWNDITLKRGITRDMVIWDWRAEVALGDPAAARRNGTVSLVDARDQVVARWTFENGWPAAITVPSGGPERPIEVVTLVVESTTRVAP